MTEESCEELLFFDTFSHQNLEHPELNLDLVHFPTPVGITDIRIIPLGARIQADFPGGVRLGATNPSQFSIEFFINDLTKPALSTFESFGSLDYNQNGCINLLCANSKHVPTDGLILKGYYSTITLAVYGVITKVISAPTVEEVQTNLKLAADTDKQPESSTEAVSESTTLITDQLVDEEKHVAERELIKIVNEPETVTVPEADTQPESKSLNESDPKMAIQQSDEVFEPILSDEDDIVDTDPVLEPERESDTFDDDMILSTEDDFKIYDPFVYEFQAIQKPPFNFENINQFENQLKMLCETIADTNEQQVLKIEQLDKLIKNHKREFAEFSKNTSKLFLNTFQPLVQFGLNFQLAMNQVQLPFKVRHSKSTFRLIETCLDINPDLVQTFPKQFLCYVYNQLFSLLSQEYMALSLKLIIFRLFDHFFNSVYGIQIFIQIGGYKKLLNILSSYDHKKAILVRIKFAVKSLLNKLHLFELLVSFSNLANSSDNCDHTKIEMALEQIESNFRNKMGLKYAHPCRFLPVLTQFDFTDLETIQSHFYCLFVRYFKLTNFLPAAVLVLTSVKTSAKVTVNVMKIVDYLLQVKVGFEYLLDDCCSLNLLLKIFLDQPNQIFGLEISYKLQSYYQLVYEVGNLSDILNFVYCLTYSPIGKMCLGQVGAILFDELVEKLIENKDNFLNAAYIVDILHLTFIFGNNLKFLTSKKDFGGLRDIIQKLEKDDTDSVLNKKSIKELQEIMNILSPYTDGKMSPILDEDIDKLIEILRKNFNTVTCNKMKPLSVLLLRVLCHRTSLNEVATVILSKQNFKQLKHKYLFIKMNSLDVLSTLLSFLDKVCTNYSHVQIYRSAVNTTNFQMVFLSVNMALKLIRKILEHVIDARKDQFNDLTAISILLKTYSIMASLKPQSNVSKECQNIICDIILSFTQPFLNDSNDSKTLWTQMVGQVLKFAISLPRQFIPTLKLLTEMLPLPLPIPVKSKDAMSTEELNYLLNLRKLWSCNLSYHNNELYDLIHCLCRSRDGKVLRLLEKFCGQVGDLTASSASMIARILLNILAESKNNNDLIILNFVACAFQQSAIKVAVLHLLNDEKFKDLFGDVLANKKTADKTDCVLNMIQALCDSEIGLVANVVDSMPSKDCLQRFINILIRVLEDHNRNIIIITSVLRIFLLLTEQDYGFYYLKAQLLRDSLKIGLIGRLIKEIKSKTITKDFLVVLMQFVNNCVTVSTPNRALKMTLSEMQYLLNWSDTQKNRLLSLFEKFPELIDLLNRIIKLLDKSDVVTVKEESGVPDITSVTNESLTKQFESRQVVTAIENNDEINFWIGSTSLSNDDDNSDDDKVDKKYLIEMNLLDVFQNSVSTSGVSLKQLVENLYKDKDEQETKNDAKPKLDSGSDNSQKVLTSGKQQIFSRAGIILPQRTDLFRSRPPNTSRPPSLHVDDFLALENCGAQPTGPTGYNKMSRDIFNSRVIARTRNVLSTESSYFLYNRGLNLHHDAQYREAYYANPYSYLRPGTFRKPIPNSVLMSSLPYPFLRKRD